MLKVHTRDINDNHVKTSLLRVEIQFYVGINRATGDLYGDALKIHRKG